MKQYSNDEKNHLLSYIYNKINLSDLKYKILESESDLIDIKKGYYVSPNYNGINCLLVFFKSSDKHYSFLVERKTLNYNWSQIDLDRIKIHPVKIRFREDIYNGTIFDGILNSGINNFFTICDTYYFRGENFLNIDVFTKSLNISAYLKCNYIDDDNLNDLKIKVSKFKDLFETKNLINNIDPDARGIAFYPKKSGLKYLLINLQSQKKQEIKDNNNIYEEIPNNTEGVFKIKKTETIDVYNLYLCAVIKKKERNVLKSRRIDIAYIPTIECSKKCRDILKNKDNTLIYCIYNKVKNKWIPIKECNTKNKPDLISDIYKLK